MTSKYTKWVSTYGNAVSINENRPESYGKNITFIYKIKSVFDGDALRITLDNYCGIEAVTVDKASIIMRGEVYPLTFRDSNLDYKAIIKPGERVVSDELDVDIMADEDIEVRFYFADFTSLRSAVFVSGPLSGGSYAIGDFTEKIEVPIEVSKPTSIYYFLTNVSVRTKEENKALVCYGDSITAGDWPDYLALYLKEKGINNISVIRRATSGSRILREYSCITYESYGLKGDRRFDYEVPTDGAYAVIIQHGINDIIHPVGVDINPFRPMSDLPTAAELIDGFRKYVDSARRMGLKVYGGTLLPIKGWRTYQDFREELKNEYNDFIRNSEILDGCIDFDKAIKNPQCPEAMLPELDSGDHLHPSAKGYKTMAKCIDIF